MGVHPQRKTKSRGSTKGREANAKETMEERTVKFVLGQPIGLQLVWWIAK